MIILDILAYLLFGVTSLVFLVCLFVTIEHYIGIVIVNIVDYMNTYSKKRHKKKKKDKEQEEYSLYEINAIGTVLLYDLFNSCNASDVHILKYEKKEDNEVYFILHGKSVNILGILNELPLKNYKIKSHLVSKYRQLFYKDNTKVLVYLKLSNIAMQAVLSAMQYLTVDIESADTTKKGNIKITFSCEYDILRTFLAQICLLNKDIELEHIAITEK